MWINPKTLRHVGSAGEDSGDDTEVPHRKPRCFLQRRPGESEAGLSVEICKQVWTFVVLAQGGGGVGVGVPAE